MIKKTLERIIPERERRWKIEEESAEYLTQDDNSSGFPIEP